MTVSGTKGYEQSADRFISISQTLDFHKVCKDFIPFLPSAPARILDVGAGAGQNADALHKMGHVVTAVEPVAEFLEAARARYPTSSVRWVKGSLPTLDCLSSTEEPFDFILVEAMWHHLNDSERIQSIMRFKDLLTDKGRCAFSLRNGPAGLSSCVYRIDVDATIKQLKQVGFTSIFCTRNQPSILPNKQDVTWARLVVEKL